MDDTEIVLMMMMDRNEDGLRLFIDRFGAKAKGFLRKVYGNVLSPAELDEAFYRAVHRAWDKIDTYDELLPTTASSLLTKRWAVT